MAQERLQKIIAASGITSRRKAETLITSGAVFVNGKQITALGTKADPQNDTIIVAGTTVSAHVQVYYAFHKPLGIITTMHDEKGRRCVGDYLRNLPVAVFPVGRLDQDSSGLLLVTNNGDFAQKMLHPSHEVPKTYQVIVSGRLSDQAAQKIAHGVRLKEGTTAPADIAIIAVSAKQTTVQLTIHEGWNRQVRRMFGAAGFPVLALHRIAIGPIQLDNLPPGKIRPLQPKDIAAIMQEQ